MNKLEILKELSIISPFWASKIKKYYRNKELDQLAHTTCYTPFSDSEHPYEKLELKDYAHCIVGEAFCFPKSNFYLRDNSYRIYANCVTCQSYSNILYQKLSTRKGIDAYGFWLQLGYFTSHFKRIHLEKYYKKLMKIYIKKLENQINYTEKLLIIGDTYGQD